MKNKSDITVILDRSGSMETIRKATISGLNKFLEEQKTNTVETVVSLVQFDDQYEVHYSGVSVRDVKDLTMESFVPRGSTALLDAIGRTIKETGERLAKLPEYERPSRVIVVIVTDGFENASRVYTRDQIFDMVRHQEGIYSWNFIYLAAGQDAIAVGQTLGMMANKTMTYNNSDIGVQNTFGSVGRSSKFLSECDLESYNQVLVGATEVFNEDDKLNALS